MNYFQSDSRWILALQWLAAELHPNLFPDFDMEAEIRSFYTDFYGLESEEILEALVHAYRSSVSR
jgi:iron complex transport system substrate-binding protein